VNRTGAALLVFLVGCATEAPPPREEPPPAARLAPEPPPAEAPVAETEDSEDETPLPASIPLGASMTRFDPAGGPPVTVSSKDGRPVRWSRTSEARTPQSFDAGAVRAVLETSHLLRAWRKEPARVRLDCVVRGLPEDAFRLQLVPGDSLVEWAGEKSGTIDSLPFQGWIDGRYPLHVLTSPPPAEPDIRTARIALRVHQVARADILEAAIGIDEVAVFDFGDSRSRWTLSSDNILTEFSAGANRRPITPLLYDGSGRFTPLIRLVDARGVALEARGSSGAGSQSITTWSTADDSPIAVPVRVTMEIPSEKESHTTTVVLTLEDVKPRR